MHKALVVAALALGVGACVNPPSRSTAMSGKELYVHWCADCHDPGPGHPGTLRMAGNFGEGRAVLLQIDGLDQGYVRMAVRSGFQMMPPFRRTEITDVELDRLARYVVNRK